VACALAVAGTIGAVAPAAAPAAESPSMSWAVISRFGGDADGDGRLDTATRESPAELGVFAVLVRPSRATCAAADSARWLVDGEKQSPRTRPEQLQQECRALLHVRGEGKHRIEVRAGVRSEVAAVEIDDRLVVALGDSVASGEGNPGRRGQWLDAPCHRSSTAGFEQAARLVAEAMTRRSITFVSLACSGAAIDKGLLGPYAGVAPERDRRYEPQVRRLERIADARAAGVGNQPPVDAVLLSVGANDVHFSEVVKACALRGNCRRSHDKTVFADLDALGDRYDTLAGELEAAAPGSPVLITRYFDPTRDERGRFCRSSVGLAG
jgi:hypothetical protein